jgi:hypothetical protein
MPGQETAMSRMVIGDQRLSRMTQGVVILVLLRDAMFEIVI